MSGYVVNFRKLTKPLNTVRAPRKTSQLWTAQQTNVVYIQFVWSSPLFPLNQLTAPVSRVDLSRLVLELFWCGQLNCNAIWLFRDYLWPDILQIVSLLWWKKKLSNSQVTCHRYSTSYHHCTTLNKPIQAPYVCNCFRMLREVTYFHIITPRTCHISKRFMKPLWQSR